jgi:hypothetical protein
MRRNCWLRCGESGVFLLWNLSLPGTYFLVFPEAGGRRRLTSD